MREWHKSTYSGEGANCVEVAEGEQTLMRDTQNRDQALLAVPASEWHAFITAAADGQL
ncbi:DUF397 domain-containing protein [Nocardiopsis sp. RSe5-2]|uniref:DUF397 domain-containing protein n=1 Tax=Nocardiopsis endophytica TaxID=3018445 RepID=A0ABT4UBJ3_9ACTN|nr:DUF397 domain-containing protein [Nocardiopsis endophytica]MDA2814252.1 DUF397 domain-containing protein [Nocardiopsis endophytica]